MVNPNNPQKNDTMTAQAYTLVVVDFEGDQLVLADTVGGPRQKRTKAWWALWAENPAATFGHLDVQVERVCA